MNGLADGELVDRVRGRLAATGVPPSPAAVAAAVRSVTGVSGHAQVDAVLDRLRAELAGAGPLESLLLDPLTTDVLVNGPAEVWVERGAGLERTPVRFPSEEALRRLAQRLAASTGRRLDDAQPYVDARLPDGTRLNAVLPPVAASGTCLSLRVPRRRTFSLTELVAAGTMPSALADTLEQLIRCRLAFLISGGTGSGKTTLLSALLSVVDPAERVVLVEDSAELLPACPHLVRLEARPPNVEGAGAVTLRDLVRQALRMRPDRIVVGEVRGAEVADLLGALNTGHEGGCGTLHANSAADVPARLEALAAVSGLPRAALHSQLGAALDAVIHLRRDHSGRRFVAELDVLSAGQDGLVRACPALQVGAGRIRARPAVELLRQMLLDRGAAPSAVAGCLPDG